MRTVVLFLLAVGLSSSVSALATLNMKEDAVNERKKLLSIDGTKERVTVADGSALPAHFELFPNGEIQLNDAKGADYENPKLRRFSFKLTVKNIGSGAERQEDVVINILDANDEPPRITGPFPSTPLYPEGLPQNLTGLFYKGVKTHDGAFIYCLTASDPDTNAKLSYSFTPVEKSFLDFLNKNFKMVGVGCIVRKGNTDLLTTPASYRFPVRVTDLNSEHPDKASSDVYVSASLEFQPPQIAATPYTIQFTEGTVKGTIIGTLYAVQMTNRANKLEWSVTDKDAGLLGWPFAVNKNTGAITLTDDTNTKVYNRVCVQQWHAKVTVTEINSQAKVKSSSTVLIIQLMDKNNFAPFFERPINFARVSETIAKTKEIMSINVVDPDSTSNKDLKYSLEGDDYKFFRVEKSAKGPFYPAVIYASGNPKLDYEDPNRTNHWYNFKLIANDGVHTVQQTSVIVEVTNANDEEPFYKTPNAIVTVNRDSFPNVIYQVQASDPDGSTVHYSFNDTGSVASSEFTIDAKTGVVQYKTKADEKISERELIISSTDQGDCSFCDSTSSKLSSKENFKLIVKFIDPNKYTPSFDVCPLVIEVKEEDPIGTVVDVKLKATDRDIGKNGEITYKLKKNEYTDQPTNYFNIEPKTGKITTARKFNREDYAADYWSVWITVEASDSGDDASARLTASCTMHLKIKDINDNAPIFQVPSISGMPNAFVIVMQAKLHKKDDPIMKVFAYDADEFDTPNSEIEYKMVDGSPPYVQMNPKTGELTFSSERKLDMTERLITFKVTASDKGTPSKSATATVEILVTDDEKQLPPSVTYKETLTVLENTTDLADLVVITAQQAKDASFNMYEMNGNTPATNKGKKPLAKTGSGKTYIVQKNDAMNAARLDHVYYSARMQLNSYIEYKGVKRYAYTLIYILVTVKDVNNKVPHFITFSSSNAFIKVPENSDFSTASKNPITTIFAADQDKETDFSKVKMELKKTEDHDKFAFLENQLYINKETVLAGSFDFENKSSYRLEVLAKDSAPSSDSKRKGQPNEELIMLTVQVTDVNDQKPTFSKTLYETNVPESAKIDYPVLKLKADDVDMVSKTSLTYNIENADSSPFGINARTGQIYLARRLDHEKKSSYTIDCKVFDGKFSAETKVKINVLNAIDEPPEFVGAPYTLPSFEMNPWKVPDPWTEFTVKDPDNESASSAIKVTALGKWTMPPHNYFGISRVKDNKWKFIVKSQSMQPSNTTETLDRQYRFILKAEKEIVGQKPIVSYAHVKVSPVKSKTTVPLCFKPGTLLGWPKVGDQTALTLAAVNPDSPSTSADLEYAVKAPKNYEIKDKNKVNYKPPAKAVEPNTVKSLMVTVKDPSATKEVSARAFVMVQPKSLEKPTCQSNTVTVLTSTKVGEIFFALRIQDKEEADRGKLSYEATPKDHPLVKLTWLKYIDAVGFSLKANVSVGTGIANIVVSAIDSDPAVSKPPNTCIVNFNVEDGVYSLKMKVEPETKTINENLKTGLPMELAKITVTDSIVSQSNIDISMELSVVNPGLELVRTSKNTALLYVTKALDREALTTGNDDAKLVVKFIGKMVTGVTPPATGTFELTVTDVNETPNVSPMSASVLMTSTPQNVVPSFNVTDGDKKANQGTYKVEVTGSAAALFDVKSTSNGFALATKKNAVLNDKSNPLFVPVKITEGSLPPKTVMVKIALTDNKLTDTNREVNAVVSTGWHWYWLPSIAKIGLGNIYGKTLTPDIMSSLTFDIPDNKFWYPSYFSLDAKTGDLSIIGAVPAGEYTVVGRAKRGSETAKATVKIHVRVASNQAVQHSATIRINGLDAQHLVLRQKKAGKTGSSTSDFDQSILTKMQEILAKQLQTEAKKVLILSAQEFRDSTGAPYIEVLYAVSGSPYYTPSKLNFYTLQARSDLAKILPVGATLEAPIDRCSTAGTTCPFGCVNRIRVNQKDKDVTINPTASFVGLKVSIQAVCGCEFKPDYPPPDCSINACLNDGNCTLAPGTVNARCACPKGMGLTGPRCQKLDVNFNTRKGYVMTESLGSCSDLHVSFEFISTVTPSNEVLLYDGPFLDNVNDDYFLVGLEGKKPFLEILNKKGGTKKSVIIDIEVSKDKWYRLDIFYKRNGQTDDYMEIMIDRCRTGVSISALDGVKVLNRNQCTKRTTWTKTELALDRRIDVSAYPLQVGGSNLKKYNDRGLVGSIRRVRVNSKLRNLLVAKQGLSANADDNTALKATCVNTDGKPKCGEQAVCRPGPSGEMYCKCLPGYRKDISGVCTVATKIMDFQKDSLTYWKLKDDLPKDSRLRTWASIRFRTRKTHGTLLYFTSADGYRNQSVEVRLKNSRVQVVYNLGDYSFKEVTLPNMNVSDGDWHLVEMDRILNEFEIILDNGEYGNYMLFRKGPDDKYNFLTLSNEFLAGLRWKRKYTDLKQIEHIFSDLSNTCLTDVRWNDEWIPMLSADGKAKEAKATVLREQKRIPNCSNPEHCKDAPKCPAPFTCVPEIWRPLTIPACGCAVGSVLSTAGGKAVCVALGVCYPNPCRAGTCQLDSSNKRGYKCICLKGYAGDNCEIALVAVASLGGGLIALIVILLLLILLAILFYLFFVKCRRRDEKLLADPDDYTRENITPYDEEGAGEEDHDHYDLTYLRKPVTDIRPVKAVPLGAAPSRPSDLGNFLDGRLQDAENDPHGPPQDYSLDYGYEGQGSVVDDLSSLGSGTSDGSQQYDHLHNLGPKFRPLHDLYNHQRNV